MEYAGLLHQLLENAREQRLEHDQDTDPMWHYWDGQVDILTLLVGRSERCTA